jgi:hypothetical protein
MFYHVKSPYKGLFRTSCDGRVLQHFAQHARRRSSFLGPTPLSLPLASAPSRSVHGRILVKKMIEVKNILKSQCLGLIGIYN